MATNPTGGNTSLVERVKNILMTPKTEWPRIDAEPATIGGIYTSYVMILAAIPPVCLLIGMLLIGLPYVTFSTQYLVVQAIITYVLSLVGIFVMAMIIEALAPTFGGTKDRVKAFKVAAYSWTAAWVVGIFSLVPMLSILGILGLYSLYLLYLGLPVLMKTPADKAMVYVIAVIVAAVVIYLVIGAITGRILMAVMPTPSPTISITYPG